MKIHIRRKQDGGKGIRIERKHTESKTFLHYINVSQKTGFTHERMRSA